MKDDPVTSPGGLESAGNQRATSSPPTTISGCESPWGCEATAPPTTILILEDEPALREMVVRHLTRWGFRPLKAANSAEALRLFDEQGEEIKLLLTDMIIDDGTNGHDLATKLLVRFPKLKIIYSSGFDRENVEQEYGLPKDAIFIEKPFQPRELEKIIRATLE